MIYRALSMWQPWASLVAKGIKKIETRSRRTKHSGVTLIHAAKHWTRAEAEALQRFREDWPEVCRRLSADRLPLGAIVAVAWLDDCVEMTDEWIREVRRRAPMEYRMGAYLRGRFGLELLDVVELVTPIPFKGNQGYPFQVPEEALGHGAEAVARAVDQLERRLMS